MKAHPRLPWAPLEFYARGGLPMHSIEACPCLTNGPRIPGLCMTLRDLGTVLGIDPRQVMRWRENDIPAFRAEELADRVREHPFVIWPELAEADMARSQAEEEAKRLARLEADRERAKGWRESNPERYAAYQAEWREANRELTRRYARTYYRLNREAMLAKQAERDKRRRRLHQGAS